MNLIKMLFSIFLWVFPWPLRRLLLNWAFGYKISRQARIGFSIIVPEQLEMLEHARIGHLTMCKGLRLVRLGTSSRIGNLDWISGFPLSNKSAFQQRLNRNPSLILGDHSAITHRHLIDCTDQIVIGDFTIIAGYGTQFLTHSIDILNAKQDCQPIQIGSYCLVGTACVLLPGSALGDYCLLGANSLLNKKHQGQFSLFGGVPAAFIKELPHDAKYFSRQSGYIN